MRTWTSAQSSLATPEHDRRRFSGLTGMLAATALSGFATFMVKLPGPWQQWSYLIHTLQGLLLTGLIGRFIYLHYRRTVGVRRPGVSLTGIFAILITLGFIGSGLHIGVLGQSEGTRVVYWLHVIGGVLAVLAVVGHVILHRATHSQHGARNAVALLRMEQPTASNVATHCAVTLAGITLLTVGYLLLPSPYADKAVVEPFETTYGENLFTPSHNLTASGGFYDVKRLGRAARCGSCHQEIFDDWKSSIHAQAASDKAYQTNVNLLSQKKGMAATRYCEGCHAPVPMMSGQLSTGGRLDTPGHLEEGVTCLTCHAMRSVLDTSGVASFLYDPPVDYLFAGYDNVVARKLHDYVVRLNPQLHRQDMARAPLRTPEMCATCHAQFMEKVMNDWGWVKMQDDYTAWLKSPFSGQSNHTFAQSKAQRCQDCHYPLVTGQDPSADAAGLQRSHRLPGANTAIPFINGDHEQVALHTRFLQANQVTVTIDKPTRPQALRSDKPVQPDISQVTEPPGYYYLGDEVTINTVVSNVGVGHDFPGGTSDINEVWVHFVVVDGQNRIIYESGALDAQGSVDPNAYFYRALPVDKEGKLVWRHDLFRMVGDSFKNVIKSGGADVVTYTFEVPSWAKGPLNVAAIVKYRKLNIKYARWALKDENVTLPIVDVASDALVIPLRERIEALEETPLQDANISAANHITR